LLDILPSSFIQVNKREIVSLNMIKWVNYDEIVLKLKSDKKPVTITLGQKFRTTFMNAIK